MLGRSRRKVLVVDSGSPRNRFAEHMHGVLGNEGSDPFSLLATGRSEVAAYGVEVISGTVSKVDDTEDALTVSTVDGSTYLARTLIVATGLTDRLPGIPGLAERWGKSILHCPYCHGWEVRDQRLAVLGTSEMAIHQAQLVRQLSDKVTFLTNGGTYLDSASKERLLSRGVKISNSPIVQVLGSGDQVTGVTLENGEIVEVDAIFTIGSFELHDSFLGSLNLERANTPMGDTLAVDQMGKTSHERIWAVGNIVVPHGNVPMSIGQGSFIGASVNAALVNEDFDVAEEKSTKESKHE